MNRNSARPYPPLVDIRPACIPLLVIFALILFHSLSPDQDIPVLHPIPFFSTTLFLLWVSLGSLLLCTRISRHSTPEVFTAFILGFALRLFLMFTLSAFNVAQEETLVHEKAVRLMELPMTTFSRWGFSFFLGKIYQYFGPNICIAGIINAGLGTILPFLLYDVALRISDDRATAVRTFNFCMFLPPLFTFSVMNPKEITCVFLLGLTLWFLFHEKMSIPAKLTAAFACVTATAAIRLSWSAFPLSAVAAFAVFGDGHRKQKHLKLKTILIVIGTAGVLGGACFVLFRPLVDSILEHARVRLWIGGQAFWGTLKTSRSVTSSLLNMDNIWSVKNIIIQLARTPFSPSPLTFAFDSRLPNLFTSLNALTQYILFPLGVIGVIQYRRNSGVWLIAALETAMMCVAGMSLMLGLTLSRHSVPHFATLYILAALGVPHWKKHPLLLWLWVFGTTGFSVLYILTR